MSAIRVVAAGAEPEVGHRDDAAPDSVLARLREQTKRQDRELYVDVEIGGVYDPPIVARYGVLPVRELERYSELAGSTSNIELMLDLLGRTCKGLRSEGVELVDELGPLTYGHRLAVALGMPIPPGEEDLPPRDVILMLFGGNGFAIGAHVTEVLTWLRNPGGPSPGEASGATA